jgi:hypothetical protein
VIHRGPQNAVQIREWLRAADEKLKDAQNESVSKGTRMDAAYDVVLCCGLTVRSAQGWRAGSEPGHHACGYFPKGVSGGPAGAKSRSCPGLLPARISRHEC